MDSTFLRSLNQQSTVQVKQLFPREWTPRQWRKESESDGEVSGATVEEEKTKENAAANKEQVYEGVEDTPVALFSPSRMVLKKKRKVVAADESELIGRLWLAKFRKLESRKQVQAEKAVNDIFYSFLLDGEVPAATGPVTRATHVCQQTEETQCDGDVIDAAIKDEGDEDDEGDENDDDREEDERAREGGDRETPEELVERRLGPKKAFYVCVLVLLLAYELGQLFQY